MDAHHETPVQFTVEANGEAIPYRVRWTPADSQLRRSYLNEEDAKRDGAYAVALATVDDLRQLVAVARCEHKTGADYYVAPYGSDPEDLENVYRLEVSGSDSDEAQVRYRLKQKQQARDGKSNKPALAAVVGFKIKLVLVEPA
ncbi:Uncharacterised protein [Burkholderia pseudomallei]|nr:hypothetical protein DR55_988 [Burkholderia pseudomallei HBPUB10134a]CAJ3214077.1 Uncharacterised protein [Burkholderia pseudomallei]CAJ4278034.1 Uncharacterised protein [Burkholderia pseudomallei]CAJ4379073.1 Uncharacterised protein [Burkholderia pseudomallei]CAJ5071126.1 Uncharacterised protein [Burkholderia pseudomallei]